MRLAVTRLLAATLIGVAASVVLSFSPAVAAACPSGTGVSVVVGSSVSCDADGGGSAASNFKDAGHALTYVQRQPGFVCQVDGAPNTSCVSTPPADAYWGLFWSDGRSGRWTYASSGVGGLTVPAGGWVAFVFQSSDTKTYPGVTPVAPSAPKPSAMPTIKPKPTPTATIRKPTATSTTRGATATPSVGTATPTPTASGSTPTPTTTTSAPADIDPTSDTPRDDSEKAAATADDSSGSGPLALVAGGLVVVLLGGMGAVLLRRRAGRAS